MNLLKRLRRALSTYWTSRRRVAPGTTVRTGAPARSPRPATPWSSTWRAPTPLSEPPPEKVRTPVTGQVSTSCKFGNEWLSKSLVYLANGWLLRLLGPPLEQRALGPPAGFPSLIKDTTDVQHRNHGAALALSPAHSAGGSGETVETPTDHGIRVPGGAVLPEHLWIYGSAALPAITAARRTGTTASCRTTVIPT